MRGRPCRSTTCSQEAHRRRRERKKESARGFVERGQGFARRVGIMRRPSAPSPVLKRRDAMAMAAAPYLHPKLSSVDATLSSASEKPGDVDSIQVTFVHPRPQGIDEDADGKRASMEGARRARRASWSVLLRRMVTRSSIGLGFWSWASTGVEYKAARDRGRRARSSRRTRSVAWAMDLSSVGLG